MSFYVTFAAPPTSDRTRDVPASVAAMMTPVITDPCERPVACDVDRIPGPRPTGGTRIVSLGIRYGHAIQAPVAGSDVVESDLTWPWLVARGLHESRVGSSPGHPHLLKNSMAESRLTKHLDGGSEQVGG